MSSRKSARNVLRHAGLVAGFMLSVAAQAAESPLPSRGDADHLGVATCASSMCHGSTKPFKESDVMQNEYLTWHRYDHHARAWKTLLSDRSIEIARRLGVGPAHEAPECLHCHTDFVDPARRGDEYQISDGVGCEACHGGAEKWIRSHADGENTHADNLADGMYPTEDPVQRARLCQSCHYSHPEAEMTHRLMGAGHPELLFELDTFTDIQPAHFRRDEDYGRRKGYGGPADEWIRGQVLAVSDVLGRMGSEMADQAATFPELYLFNCNACHHRMMSDGYVPREDIGLPPGTVRLRDENLRMFGHILEGAMPELAREWRNAVQSLHYASLEHPDVVARAVEELDDLHAEAASELKNRRLPDEAILAITRDLVERTIEGGYADRLVAQQAVMALQSLLDELKQRRAIPVSDAREASERLDATFQSFRDDGEPFRAKWFREQMEAVGEVL